MINKRVRLTDVCLFEKGWMKLGTVTEVWNGLVSVRLDEDGLEYAYMPYELTVVPDDSTGGFWSYLTSRIRKLFNKSTTGEHK